MLRQGEFEEAVYAGLSDLTRELNRWCAENKVQPLSGAAAEKLTVRTLRYYRSLGLMDAPLKGQKYGRRHFLQLTVIRSLQSRGLPLEKIRGVLGGKTDAELHELVRASRSGDIEEVGSLGPFRSLETLEVVGLTDDFALLSRRRARLRPEVLEKLVEVLAAEGVRISEGFPVQETSKVRRARRASPSSAKRAVDARGEVLAPDFFNDLMEGGVREVEDSGEGI